MKLSRIASRFDTVPCRDAYDSSLIGYGQLDVFDDSKRDAYGTVRRTMSFNAQVQMPARRVIDMDTEQWIVGNGQSDFWRGSVIRRKYVIHRADGLANLHSLASFLDAAPAVQAYAAGVWLKDTKQIEVDSTPPSAWQLYLARGEGILPTQVIELGGYLYIVHSTHETTAGFVVADAERLDTDAADSVVFASVTLDPVLDTKAEVVATVPALNLRWQALYDNENPASLKYEPGDRVVVVSSAHVTAPKPGDHVVTAKSRHEVIAVEAYGSAFALHVRQT